MKYLFVLILLLPVMGYTAWQSSDKKTPDQTLSITSSKGGQLNAYVWLPEGYDMSHSYKAVVLAHGCGGAHYKDEPHKWTARYIAGKFKVWGKLFNEQGLIVMLVDSFSTRDLNGDVGGGVCSSSDTALNRPEKIDPVTVRPADIADGIAYLKQNYNVEKVGVVGFSNGGTSALVLANHEQLAQQDISPKDGFLDGTTKAWFDVPFEPSYQANLIVSMYPGCGLNGYTSSSVNTITSFDTYTDSFLFIASTDTALPNNTKEKCQNLAITDAQGSYVNSNMMLTVVPDTNHQFDYKENNEPAVQAVIQRILALFESM